MNRGILTRRKALIQSCGAVLAANTAANPVLGAVLSRDDDSRRRVDPRSFGAKGDGQTKDTNAIQQAIDRMASQGGGSVIVSPGTYLCGTIVLKSNITLQVQQGATILGSPDPNDYTLPADALGALRGVLSRHLVFAFNATNVTILGPGTIDGNSSMYLVPSGHPAPKPEDDWRDVAAFYTQRTVRISPMVDLANCTNVRVEGIRLQNAVGWTLRPTGCKTVVIRGVTVRNPLNASNSDGIDPTSCDDVLVADCDIVTGDDAICVKSNNPYGGRSVCSNVTVRNCRVSTCCNGLKVGVEGPAGFHNIVFDNCEVYSSEGPLNERVISGIAVEMVDGASIDGVTFTNITMRNARTPVFIRLQGKVTHSAAPMQGSLRNIRIDGLRSTGSILTSSITGQPGFPVENVTLSNVQITTEEHGREEWADTEVPEKPNAYAEASMFGRLPVYGVYARHVRGLKLEKVSVDGSADPRPLLACEDVQGLSIVNINGTSPSSPRQPFLKLHNVRDASIQTTAAPSGTAVFAKISGETSKNIRLHDLDTHKATRSIQITDEVPRDAIAR